MARKTDGSKKDGRGGKSGTRAAGTAGTPGARRKRAPDGPDAQRERLEKELRGLLPAIDKEGLIFLIQQAHTLLHNLQVEKLNREIEELQSGDGPAGGSRPCDRGTGPAPSARAAVAIEEAELGDSFTLVVRGKRSILTVAEMRQIVRYCYSPETKSEALRQLFAWFTRERKDILLNAGVQDAQSAFFQSLFDAVRARFRLKDH